jgi:HlyD family secretion protein
MPETETPASPRTAAPEKRVAETDSPGTVAREKAREPRLEKPEFRRATQHAVERVRRQLPWLMALAIAIIGGVGFYWWTTHRPAVLPPYIVKTNGRLEFARTDIAVKYPGRIVMLDVHEGDHPERGQILARQDDSEVNAELAAARAQRAAADGAIARAQAEVQAHRSREGLARLERAQADSLYAKKLISDVELQRRELALSAEKAAVTAATAALAEARTARDEADAKIAQLEARLGEMTIRAPVAGRIEYKVIENGAVLPPGGRVATLLDPTDVYMTVFLGTEVAGKLKVGDEARIELDAFRGRPPIPAFVSFISPEAQFTPKYVETATERDKLMYRVKLQIPVDVAKQYDGLLKAGQTGNGYVRVDSNAHWPAGLIVRAEGAPQ